MKKKNSDKSVSLYLVRETTVGNSRFISEDESGYVLEKFAGGADYTFLPLPCPHIWVRYPEKEENEACRLEKIRIMAAEILGKLKTEKYFRVGIIDETWEQSAEIEAFMESLYLSSYSFDEFKKSKNPVFEFGLTSGVVNKTRQARLRTLCAEVNRSKYLIDLPFSALNARQLGEWAEKDAGELGLKVRCWSAAEIEKSGMGGLLGVNKGSIDKPSFTEMTYKPAHPVNKNPIVLVGKGVVFDAGGMNIKTGNYMEDMKTDMAGAALVIGVMRSIAALGLPVYVEGLIPATDNRLNGNALVCGDIITMYDGTTVEITNTDAEGRLLLADAVAYAGRRFDPELIVSMATLTGAASRALGTQGIAAMQQDADPYVAPLTEAGDYTHERLCFFPMWKEYEKELDSEVADLKNCGNGPAGMITAAKFVRYFAKAPFVHLDVAGVEFLHKKDAYRGPGATAFGIRLLVKFFEILSHGKGKLG